MAVPVSEDWQGAILLVPQRAPWYRGDRYSQAFVLSTAKDSLQTADQKAFNAAMGKPTAERAEALRQFLKNFPESSFKEQANYNIAMSAQNPDDRIAALHKFLEDFPNSTLKDQANIQIALSPRDTKERMAALRYREPLQLLPGPCSNFMIGLIGWIPGTCSLSRSSRTTRQKRSSKLAL